MKLPIFGNAIFVSVLRFRIKQGYDVPTLSQYLDFISVMTYDLRGSWDGSADHHAPLDARSVDVWAYKTLNAKHAMQFWADQGAPKEKLILGVPFYARTFTLKDKNEHEPGAKV